MSKNVNILITSKPGSIYTVNKEKITNCIWTAFGTIARRNMKSRGRQAFSNTSNYRYAVKNYNLFVRMLKKHTYFSIKFFI